MNVNWLVFPRLCDRRILEALIALPLTSCSDKVLVRSWGSPSQEVNLACYLFER